MASSTMADPAALAQALALGTKTTGMDTSMENMERMGLETKKAYDAEIAGSWSLAYDLHDGAAKMWTAHADAARRDDATEQVYRIFSKQRVELHKERMSYLEPFAKKGAAVPSPVLMHPIFSLASAGFTEHVELEEVKKAGVESFKKTLPLSLVRDFLVPLGR